MGLFKSGGKKIGEVAPPRLVMPITVEPSKPRSWAFPISFLTTTADIACEQALSGGGGAKEGKMERELATTSQEFEYLHRKFRCKILIGELVMTSSVFTQRRQNKRRMRRIKQRI